MLTHDEQDATRGGTGDAEMTRLVRALDTLHTSSRLSLQFRTTLRYTLAARAQITPRRRQPAWLARVPSVLLALAALVSSISLPRLLSQSAGGRPHPAVHTVRVGGTPRVLALSAGTNHLFVAAEGTPYKLSRSPRRSSISMLDTRTSALLRTWPLAPAVDHIVDVASDDRAGRILIAAEDTPHQDADVGALVTSGRLLVIDARTGGLLREFLFPLGLDQSRLAVDERTHHVVAVTTTRVWPPVKSVVTIDDRTGTVVHTATLPNESAYAARVLQTAAVDERAGLAFLCLAGTEGTVVMSVVDTHTGSIMRTIPTGMHDVQVAVDANRNHLFLSGVRRGQSQNALGESHVEMWSTRTQSVLATAIAARGSRALQIVVDAPTARVFVSSPSWFSLRTPAAPQGNVLVLDGGSGRLLRTIRGWSGYIAALDARTGRLVVTTGRSNTTGQPLGQGTVDVLDGRTGDMLRRIPLANWAPNQAVLDGQTGRLFLTALTPDGTTGQPDGSGRVLLLDGALER